MKVNMKNIFLYDYYKEQLDLWRPLGPSHIDTFKAMCMYHDVAPEQQLLLLLSLMAIIISTSLRGWLGGGFWPKPFMNRLAVPDVWLSSKSRNLLFDQGAGDSSLILHERYRGTFNVHQLMPAYGTPSLTSNWGMAHTLMNHPASETPGRQFIAGPRFEPRLDSLEASLRTSLSKPPCQTAVEH